MKFRAKITDASYIKHFNNSIQTIAKFCKQCVVRVSSEGLFFIAFEESGERQPTIWFTLSQDDYFNEFNLVGVTQEHNEICFRISPHVVVKVLYSIKPSRLHSKALKISLTKRKTPCLTFEYLRTEPEQARMCLHDVPIEIIPRKDWGDISPPKLSLPDLCVTLPDVENLEVVWDRLKSLSRHIVILASGRGVLSLRSETDITDVTSHFRELPVVCSPDYENLDEYVKGRVKCSKFLLLRELCQGNRSRTVLKIRDKKYILFEVFFEALTVHYIVPAVQK